MRRALILCLLLSIILVGCYGAEEKSINNKKSGNTITINDKVYILDEKKDEMGIACINACKAALKAGKNLSSGPCLLDSIPGYPAYGCDVVHNPKQPVDYLPENFCNSFLNSSVHLFLDITPDCELFVDFG